MSEPTRTVVRVRPRDGYAPRTAPEPVDIRTRLLAGTPRRTRILLAATVLAAVSLVLLLTFGRSGDDYQRHRDAAVAAASAGVDSVLQLASGQPLAADVFSDDLADSLASGSESFLGELQASGLGLTGGTVRVGVLSIDDRTAELLVATTGDIRDATGAAVSAHQISFVVSLTASGADWLVDGLEVVS